MTNVCKKTITTLLFLVVLFAFYTSTTFASDETEVVQFPVYDSAREAFESSLEDNLEYNLQVGTTSLFRSARLEPVFIRSGNTTKVDVYVHYSGDDRANAVKITNFEIWNTNLLNRKQLVPTFSPGTKDFAGSKNAYVPLKVVSLAKSVTAVRVDVGTYQAYIMRYGWISAGDPVGEKPIK